MIALAAVFKSLWEYRFTLLLLAGLATAAVLYDRVYTSGYEACKVKAITAAVEVREVQNEIRNNRPDDAALIERLRRGTF